MTPPISAQWLEAARATSRRQLCRVDSVQDEHGRKVSVFFDGSYMLECTVDPPRVRWRWRRRWHSIPCSTAHAKACQRIADREATFRSIVRNTIGPGGLR